MSSKDVFLNHKELRSWWASVVDDPQFEEVLLFARSEMLESKPKSEGLEGALRYETILRTLPVVEDSSQPMPSTGLNFFADEMPAKPKPQRAPKPKTKAK